MAGGRPAAEPAWNPEPLGQPRGWPGRGSRVLVVSAHARLAQVFALRGTFPGRRIQGPGAGGLGAGAPAGVNSESQVLASPCARAAGRLCPVTRTPQACAAAPSSHLISAETGILSTRPWGLEREDFRDTGDAGGVGDGTRSRPASGAGSGAQVMPPGLGEGAALCGGQDVAGGQTRPGAQTTGLLR